MKPKRTSREKFLFFIVLVFVLVTLCDFQWKRRVQLDQNTNDSNTDTSLLNPDESLQHSEQSWTVAKPILKSPSGSFFWAESNIKDAPYRIRWTSQIEIVSSRISCPVEDTDCALFSALHRTVLESISDERDARLHVVLLDPFAIESKQNPSAVEESMQTLAKELRSERNYITYKGSDFVLVCLTSFCQPWAEKFVEVLANDQGTRAIYVGVDVKGMPLGWPCPLRVIDVYANGLEDVSSLWKKILRRASFMTEKQNRWICSDKKHPPEHFGRHLPSMPYGGVFMERYGFLMCAIPKSGCTMLLMLLRRMTHQQDWRSEQNGLPHDHEKNGLVYLEDKKFDLLNQVVYEDPRIIKAVVVRHPIPRLLSGYLDKIWEERRYEMLPGFKEHVKELDHYPTFSEFALFLMEHFPDPSKVDEHFSSQSSHCGLSVHNFDFVGTLSNLGTQFKEFSQSLDFWDPYVMKGWGKDGRQVFGQKSYESRQHGSDSPEHVWEHYTEDLMWKVYFYYKTDFEQFGFTLDEYLTTKPTE